MEGLWLLPTAQTAPGTATGCVALCPLLPSLIPLMHCTGSSDLSHHSFLVIKLWDTELLHNLEKSWPSWSIFQIPSHCSLLLSKQHKVCVILHHIQTLSFVSPVSPNSSRSCGTEPGCRVPPLSPPCSSSGVPAGAGDSQECWVTAALSGHSSWKANWRWDLPPKDLEGSAADQPGNEKQVYLLKIKLALALYVDFSVLETTGIHLQNKPSMVTTSILTLNLFVLLSCTSSLQKASKSCVLLN